MASLRATTLALATWCSTSLLLTGCSDPGSPSALADSSTGVTDSASASSADESTTSTWAGIPIEREVRSPDGWSYKFTIDSLPEMSVDTDVSSSPPGSARLVVAASGAFTTTWESLDSGRTAPELRIRLEWIGWDPPVAPDELSSGYREFAPLSGDLMDGAMVCRRPLRSDPRVECGTAQWDPTLNPSGDTDAQAQTDDMPEYLAEELQDDVLVPANQYAEVVVANEYGNCLDRFFVLPSGEERQSECNSGSGP